MAKNTVIIFLKNNQFLFKAYRTDIQVFPQCICPYLSVALQRMFTKYCRADYSSLCVMFLPLFMMRRAESYLIIVRVVMSRATLVPGFSLLLSSQSQKKEFFCQNSNTIPDFNQCSLEFTLHAPSHTRNNKTTE